MATSKTSKEAAAVAPSAAPDAAEPTAEKAAMQEESSRVFVKNLPPNITEDQLRKHFSGGGRHITDIKLIARRRIAFVGYQSPEEAKAAVRYFNRTFIRMSKLSVEMAKPISDPTLPTAHKMQRLHELHTPAEASSQSAAAPAPAAETETAAAAKKRKREELDAASNPKLREFLEVMKPQTKGGLSSTADVLVGDRAVDVDTGGDVQMAVIDDAGAESDEEEYQSIATKKAKLANGEAADTATTTTTAASIRKPADVAMADAPVTRVAAITATSIEDAPVAPAPAAQPAVPLQPKLDAAATDDDWLRSRTNRLLDLLDPSELEPMLAPAAVTPAAAAAAAPSVQVVDASKEDGDDINVDAKDDEKKDTGKDDDNNTTPDAAAPSSEAVVPSTPLSAVDLIRKTSRLFVRNLPYSATEAHLREYFSAFGAVEEVQLPTTNAGANKGFAMVLFADPEVALAAFHNADGKTFQGRILHVLPAKAKRTTATGELDEFALSKLPLKQQRLLRKKAEAATSSFSWNALFMSQDAVNAAMAERLGMSKSELLDPTSSDEAVRQAVRQTSVIEETKDYFESNGVDLESFKTSAKRGDSCILVKNFAHGTSSQELRKMFEEYGAVVRVLMPPSGTLAIVQFAQPAHGRLAYTKMAYRRVGDSVLMLEKCPENVLGKGSASLVDAAGAGAGPAGKQKLAASDLLEDAPAGGEEEAATAAAAEDSKTTSSLFVRNLNFTTTTELLASTFKSLAGFVGARVKTKPDPKKPGHTLSMGYGFVEFRTKADAEGACKAMDGHILQGHTLTVRASHRGAQDAAEEQRAADKAKKLAANHGSKLIVKNIPFEANRTDLRKLLGTYGQLRAVRMPKKFGSATRGYAFAEFTTPREAAAAMSALRNTHLLGRRLVIEFAAAEAVDAEEEIAKMQKKVGSQVQSVAMQKMAASRSHRSKVTIGEDEEEM